MTSETKIFRTGIDIGSTSIKIVCIDNQGATCFSAYKRHQAGIYSNLKLLLQQAQDKLGDCYFDLVITGSVGMGIAERFDFTFLQEVIAASVVVRKQFPDVHALVDIGGEDAKLILFEKNKAPVMRMNGSCAGGTGAFIDQMANLFAVEVGELDKLAHHSTNRYSISSRCGVFAKTDIQNLISRNVSRSDIASSIFYAIAHQTLTTLVRGTQIHPKILFCGAPFSHIPYMRKAFKDVLHLQDDDIIIPDNASLIPATGCALSDDVVPTKIQISDFINQLSTIKQHNVIQAEDALPALFTSDEELQKWKEAKSQHKVKRLDFKDLEESECFLGVDSGSTTTKIILIDNKENILFDYYCKNNGNPLQAVSNGINECYKLAKENNKNIIISSSCVTGYGEDLIRKAYQLEFGIVETIAHYLGALKYNPDVSFVLDIGGQDMKAIYVENGLIKRIEVNEACSSGCGSFIDSFAASMKYSSSEFDRIACEATQACDLGTRCTVFMNSKVKQFLRTNATAGEIAAGLSYSVIKNLLHKVLKIRDIEDLGNHISVQGGSFKNLSIAKALENTTGKSIVFTDIPELMGALGCALYAKKNIASESCSRNLNQFLSEPTYTIKTTNCKACENQCFIQLYKFADGQQFVSGNKCEKHFSNKGSGNHVGENLSAKKEKLIFNRPIPFFESGVKIGIPRALNMYENYPFWHHLFTSCGINIILSDPSTFSKYEENTHTIMSDNICFPAKITHSHISNLIEKKVDRIFMPYVVFEQKEDKKTTNSFNCPIISAYSDVIKSAINPDVPIDCPSISFKNRTLLKNACIQYLKEVTSSKLKTKDYENAFEGAYQTQEKYNLTLKQNAQRLYEDAVKNNRTKVLLVARPYHHDSLIQHKASDIIASFGVDVITDDIVRGEDLIPDDAQATVMQWQYTNTIIKAAHWVAQNKNDVHLVQLSSFGCGPDAFILDEVNDILKQANKNQTILKIDDVSNQGSLRLRIRSLIESIEFKKSTENATKKVIKQNAIFEKKDINRKILVPFFSEFYSPFIPPLFNLLGYELENLPPSNKESQEYGLKYINNEVCYPTTLVVGDLVKALKSGKYDLDKVAVGMTQTGGQCRATNYISQIKKGLLEAGLEKVPVISVTTGGSINNPQPGFNIDWKKVAVRTFNTLLYADFLSKLYYASIGREKEKGSIKKLKEKYIQLLINEIDTANTKRHLQLLKEAVVEFRNAIDENVRLAQIGIVGEIYVKYNPQSNFHSIEWLLEQGVELVVPPLVDFGMQYFVNRKVNQKNNTEKKDSLFFDAIIYVINRYADKKIASFNKVGKDFPFYIPFTNIFDEAKHASEIVNLSGQFGEGWLIPAEYAFFATNNINHAISLQPFGCIANHIISKGIEKRVTDLYPNMNLLFLDFDSGLSQANMLNRIHFMLKNAKESILKKTY